MNRHIASFALGTLLMAGTAMAQGMEPRGPEEVAAEYFAPPETTDVPRVVTAEGLRGAGAIALATRLGEVQAALAGCKRLRFEMEALIGDTYGSYSVNPGWLNRYQNCLVARNQEQRLIGTAIDERRRQVLEANEGTAALRASDVMARLSVYQIEVKDAVQKEFAAQKEFVRYYNTGQRENADTVDRTTQPQDL
jgi:hypothetical protein